MNNQVFVNQVSREIIITRKFSAAAAKVGSPEFNQLCEVKAVFPDFPVVQRTIERNPQKKTYKGYSLEAMRKHIALAYGEGSQQAKNFDAYCSAVKAHSRKSYGMIKKEFLEKYQVSR